MTKPTPKRPRRRYTDAFRAAALAGLDANAGNVERTARDLRIPAATLDGWARGRHHPVPPELRDQKKAELGDLLERFAARLCQVDPARVENLTLRDVGLAIGILVDKVLLLRSPPARLDRPADPPSAEDYTRLTAEEITVLCELHRKARGESPPRMASDLDHPCIVDPSHSDGHYWPNGEPPADRPDDPLYEHLRRMARAEEAGRGPFPSSLPGSQTQPQ